MGKVLKIITGIGLIAAAVITGGGSLGLLGLTISKGALIAIGATVALGGVSEMMMKSGIPKSQLSRLNVSLDPSTPRKAVFGTTAMNLDLRYHEASGTNQEYIDYIIAVAAHKVKSIDEIWFEEKQAWTASGGVTSTYSGYLTVDTRTEGTAGNAIIINGGYNWGSATRLTGCAYIHLRIKRTGNDKKTESPLVNGLPSRVTVIGDGALLYDPRKDSTVPGGSGAHRVNDQSTWGDYTAADDTDNPALQLLWWLLGWKINGELSIGCGVPASRIDLESFITAANICDENVTLAIGGTQKRYRTSGTATDADDRMSVINTFLTSMNGTLRDSGGKLSLDILKNDLADYVLDFDENDVFGEFEWNQTRGLSDSYNKARGRFIDPSQNSLYQLVDYPEVGFDSPDGIERVMSLDLAFVEDGRRAQRIAKQALQRNQYRGLFSATFSAKAMGVNVGDVVRLSFETLGWSNKLFRVVSQEIRPDGQVPLSLIEESPLIYLWDAEDSAPVSPNAPTIYDPLNSPFILGTVEASTTAVWDNVTGTGKPEDFATRNNPAGTHTTSAAYSKGDFVTNAAGDATYIAKQDVPSGIALTNTIYWDLFVQGTGTPGENAISAFLTNSAHVVATATDGTSGDYSTAGGTMRVFDGFVEKTTSGTVTFSKVGTGSWYSINSSGVYTITDPGTDTATCQFDASYSGVTVRLTYSIAKSKRGVTGNPGADGAPGAAGTPAISGYLTNEATTLFAYANGDVVSYAPAAGTFVIVSGNTDISSNFTLSVPSGGNPQALSVSFTGRSYSVTDGFGNSEDTATLTIRATGSGAYASVVIDKVFTLAKAKGGYEIVSSLPTNNLFEGRVVYYTLEDKLYRYDGAGWSASVPATDITGTLADAQIAAVAASKVTGQLNDAQLAAIAAAKVTGQITGSQITDGAISVAKFASSIEPVTTVSAVPGTKSTNTIFNTTDGKLYRWSGSSYIATIPTTDLSGTVSDAQIAGLAASKVTGTLSDSQIAAISAAKVTGQLVTSQIANAAITDAKIAALSASKVTGQLSDSQLAAIDAAKVTGQLVTTQITDNAITTAKVAAGAISTNQLAANAVTAAKIAAGTITATEIASATITGAKIAAGTIDAGNIAASAITTDKLAANSITTAKIAAGAVTASQIAADTITAANIAAGAITSSELAAGSVIAGKIAAGSIVAADIAAGTITGDRLAANTITASQIAASTITSAQIAADTITAGNIAAGAISASELAVGAIEAQHIRIAPKSLNMDPTFAGGATMWGGFVRRLPKSNGAVPANCPTDYASEFNARDNFSVNPIRVVPGEVYKASGWVNRGSGSGGGGIGLVGMVLDGSGNYITSFAWPGTPTTASGWQFVSGNYTIPTNGALLQFGPWADRTAYTGEAWYADLNIEKVNDASLIVDGTITTAKIAANSITTAKIAAGAVTTNEIAANTITAGDIAAGTITGTEIAAGTITGAKIAAGTIQAGNIAAGTITADKIAGGTITADKIASNTITGDRIAAGTITAAQLATTQLISISAQIGDLVVDTINIKNNSITQASVFSDDTSITASTSWQTVASVSSGVLSGSNVKIDFSCRLIGVADTVSIPAQYRLLRGGTVIRSGVFTVFQSKQVLTDFVSGMNYEFYQPVDAAFPMFHLDVAIPSGPHTYSLQILGTSAVTVAERQMIATELRR